MKPNCGLGLGTLEFSTDSQRHVSVQQAILSFNQERDDLEISDKSNDLERGISFYASSRESYK